jgi:hypothetical protein
MGNSHCVYMLIRSWDGSLTGRWVCLSDWSIKGQLEVYPLANNIIYQWISVSSHLSGCSNGGIIQFDAHGCDSRYPFVLSHEPRIALLPKTTINRLPRLKSLYLLCGLKGQCNFLVLCVDWCSTSRLFDGTVTCKSSLLLAYSHVCSKVI